METLSELRKRLLADGVFDENDVKTLREALYGGDGMDKKKGDFLFELKDTISEERRVESFRQLFVEAICALLLEDETSPGEIDVDEAKWLRAKIQAKGYSDKLDMRLLDRLKERSINFPSILIYKSKGARFFENCLYLTRYQTILAVIGAVVSSFVLFIKGTIVVVQGLATFFRSFIDGGEVDYEQMMATFISSVDIYLFAMVLVIFGVGIYELFINKIDPVERNAVPRPTWLQVSSIDDLKSSLGKVILMILIVSFFKHSLDIQYESAKDLLLLSVGVVLTALALFIANSSHHHKSKDTNEEAKDERL